MSLGESETWELWGINSREFRRILKKVSEEVLLENMALVNAVPVFNMLARWQKGLICDGVQVTAFAPSAVVCNRGEQGRSMMIVKKGELTGTYAFSGNSASSSEVLDGVEEIPTGNINSRELILSSSSKASGNSNSSTSGKPRVYRKGEYFGTQCLLGSVENPTSTQHDDTIVNKSNEPVVCIVIQRDLLDKLDQQGVGHQSVGRMGSMQSQDSSQYSGDREYRDDESDTGKQSRERLGTYEVGSKKEVARRVSISTQSIAPLG